MNIVEYEALQHLEVSEYHEDIAHGPLGDFVHAPPLLAAPPQSSPGGREMALGVQHLYQISKLIGTD